MGPTGASRILQIHPTRRCNLRCLHCYSSSGPDEREALDADLLRGALTDARAEGYSVASFSGGEPLLYKPLPALLRHAHACGMLTTVTTNGMLLDERRLEALEGALDLLAISLDGLPASHNRMRGSERAFDTMAKRLEGVRAAGIPFGFIFTLTLYNLHELEWVAQFAAAAGARLLQVHPLEEVGRARVRLAGSEPDPMEGVYAFVEVLRVQAAVGERLLVQFDLANRNQLRANPAKVFADDAPENAADRLLGDLVSPLIIEADGSVAPVQYGFHREHLLGNLSDAPLQTLAAEWKRTGYAAFRALCRHVYEAVTSPNEFPFVNWYEAVSRGPRGATIASPAMVQERHYE